MLISISYIKRFLLYEIFNETCLIHKQSLKFYLVQTI